jgi:hypothetical protein
MVHEMRLSGENGRLLAIQKGISKRVMCFS